MVLGIIFAFGALLCWGFGDFFIQQTTRRIGDFKALFFIGLTGSILLLPFGLKELPLLFSKPFDLGILLAGSLIAMIFAPINFESLKRGKIAIVEPIIGSEIIITAAIGIFLLKEAVSLNQILLILIVFIGIALAVTANHQVLSKNRRLEAGIFLAILAALGLAVSNTIIGTSSQRTSPYLTIWVIWTLIAIFSFGYLLINKRLRALVQDFREHKKVIIPQSLFDTSGWLLFGLAATRIPISIAITISGGYVVLAVLLGVLVGREKLRTHQWLGIALVIAGEILLSAIISG